MKIILNQDVQNLGEEGDVRDVARGYARNYLFRKDLAVQYNKQNVAIFEHKKSAIEKRKEEKRISAAGVKAQIEALKLEMVMPAGTTGKLFGSVTAASLAEEMEKKGISVEKKKIDIPGNTIKMTGNHTFTVRLYGDETAECSISIASDKPITKAKKAPEVKTEEATEEEATEEEAIEEEVTTEDETVETSEETVVDAEEHVEEPADENDQEESAEEDTGADETEEDQD